MRGCMRIKGRWERFNEAHTVLAPVLGFLILVAFAVAQIALIAILRAKGWGAEALWVYLGIMAVGGLLYVNAHFRK